MECIPASEVEVATLNEFLEESNRMNRQSFFQNGYVVMSNKEIIGCFELELIYSREYWLKQLYIVQHEAAKLPVLLEYILLLAKQKDAVAVYAHSDQPVTDLLLESMCFSVQKGELNLLQRKASGQWWSYKVS